MLLIHLYVHHLQQFPHLFEIHLSIFVFVSFLKPVPDPSEKMLRETLRIERNLKSFTFLHKSHIPLRIDYFCSVEVLLEEEIAQILSSVE